MLSARCDDIPNISLAGIKLGMTVDEAIKIIPDLNICTAEIARQGFDTGCYRRSYSHYIEGDNWHISDKNNKYNIDFLASQEDRKKYNIKYSISIGNAVTAEIVRRFTKKHNLPYQERKYFDTNEKICWGKCFSYSRGNYDFNSKSGVAIQLERQYESLLIETIDLGMKAQHEQWVHEVKVKESSKFDDLL